MCSLTHCILIQVLACLLDPGRIKPHPTSAAAPLGWCLITLMLLCKSQRSLRPQLCRHSSSLCGGTALACPVRFPSVCPSIHPSPAQWYLQTTYSPCGNLAASSWLPRSQAELFPAKPCSCLAVRRTAVHVAPFNPEWGAGWNHRAFEKLWNKDKFPNEALQMLLWRKIALHLRVKWKTQCKGRSGAE